MRKLGIALALAATALSTPAFARDNSFYMGLEGGLMKVDDTELDYQDPLIAIDDAYRLDHKTGYDFDIVVGYDWGMFRTEAEFGYKRASVDEIDVDNVILGTATDATFDADGHSTAWSVMVNGLLDFGDQGFGGYVGGGIGAAKVKHDFEIDAIDRDFDASRGRLAMQAIAGVRMAVSDTFDVGLKYRYFHVSNVDYDADGPGGPFDIETKWRSHSLLLSLIFNLAPPAPPPPPPPPPLAPAAPPPATQTCPDGTVVLATETCPLPPPPPPPPSPGERG